MSREKNEDKNIKQENQVKEFKRIDPLNWFFKLGDYVTKGDVIKQQDFTYYMLFILFLAFLGIFLTNLYRFITTVDISYLFWGLFAFAITSLQYFNLKSFYQMRKARKEMPKAELENEHKVEDVDEMLKGFSGKKESDKKEAKMVKKCKSCGKEISDDTDYCKDCVDKNIKEKKIGEEE